MDQSQPSGKAIITGVVTSGGSGGGTFLIGPQGIRVRLSFRPFPPDIVPPELTHTSRDVDVYLPRIAIPPWERAYVVLTDGRHAVLLVASVLGWSGLKRDLHLAGYDVHVTRTWFANGWTRLR